MNDIIFFWKNIGETPLQAIMRLKKEKPELAGEKMTYAGRLDPLAEGVLPILIGDAVHRKTEFSKKDKEYEVCVILGVSTDTHDSLGLVLHEGSIKKDFKQSIQKFISSHIGNFTQKYPAYSSKTVGGVQLHTLSRLGEVIDLPTHIVTLKSCEIIGEGKFSKDELSELIDKNNNTVSGDFRQKEIAERWNDYFNTTEYALYPYVILRMTVGSGFYVRQFTDDIGKHLGSGAIAM